MLKSGIINPHVNSLLSRVRHTNMLVIADASFPFWPMIETVDLALVATIPTVLQVLGAIRPNFTSGTAFMASEFTSHNPLAVRDAFATALDGVAVAFEPHDMLKQRVPHAIGLIRTGDLTAYANIILVST